MERKVKFAPKEYYHIYSRGVEKRKIFLNNKDYERFVALLYIMNQTEPFNFANFLKSHKFEEIFSEEKSNPLVSILSYALMPNHFHILVYEHTEGGISKFMMRLLTAYSMYFNIKYQRSGPLFVRPFRSEHISKEAQYLWIFSYIHLNPIGIVKKDFSSDNIGNKNVAEKFLENYKYSSFPEYKGADRSESKILDLSAVPDYVRTNRSLDTKKYAQWLQLPELSRAPLNNF